MAWRHALGWTQWRLAGEYTRRHPGEPMMSTNRVSEHETWPFGGRAPSVAYLTNLAATYGHGCTPADLIDLDDLERLDPFARRVLTELREHRWAR